MKNLQAISLATRGRIPGHAIGMASCGYIIKITEEPIVAQTSVGGSIKTKHLKKITVSVSAYGKQFVTQCIVKPHIYVGLNNIEIVEKGKQNIEILVKGVKIEDVI